MVKITEQEFRDYLKDYTLYMCTKNINNNYSYTGCGLVFADNAAKKRLLLNELYIFKKWRSGGLTGGSCWGDNADIPVDSEKEPDFTEIDDILIKFIPDISFLRYKKILRLVEYGKYTTFEYYGNYTNYNYKFINLGELFDSLMNDYDYEP